MLCERHCTGVEPTVDNFRYTNHLLATFRTVKKNFINIRTMEFYGLCLFVATHVVEVFTAAYAVLVTAFTFPDVKRSTPVTVSGNCPVLNVL